jgi:hypothetical protein
MTERDWADSVEIGKPVEDASRVVAAPPPPTGPLVLTPIAFAVGIAIAALVARLPKVGAAAPPSH